MDTFVSVCSALYLYTLRPRSAFHTQGKPNMHFCLKKILVFLKKERLSFVFACEHPGVDSGTLNVGGWVLAFLLRLPALLLRLLGEGVEQT